ncbi:MAG: hypothetical protein GTN97_01640 [Nitrosopumilaceae archaeon]|nr:hypothetical protein [Nitrosopumilaceae archaeon]
MNTSKPSFIFENGFGKLIKCYECENLNSLYDRLTDEQKDQINDYLDCLLFGLTYGADIEK